MSDRCDTCALNHAGTGGAANEVHNRLKAEICARGGVPFFCHHTNSGGEYDWQTNPLGPMSVPAPERRLCAGWKAVVARLNRDGKFDVGDTPDDRRLLLGYQRSLANQACRALDRFVEEKEPAAKRAAHVELRNLLGAVFDVEIPEEPVAQRVCGDHDVPELVRS